MTLTEFLLARIAEDEVIAQSAIKMRERENARGYEQSGPEPSLLMAWDDPPGPICLIGPERVLAECEAKRRIVEHAISIRSTGLEGAALVHDQGLLDGFGFVLRYLALPCAAHPDYREEWRA